MGDKSIKRAIEDYKTLYMAYRNFADRTRIEYENDLCYLADHLEEVGLRDIGDINIGVIERYIALLEQRGYTSLTRKRKVVVIRSFLSFLFRDHYITRDLAQNLVVPFVENNHPRVLTKAEFTRLRKACAGNVRDNAIIELLLQTGLRLSELTRLTLDDVELPDMSLPVDDGVGYLRVKGGHSKGERLLPLNTVACNAIEKYLLVRPTSSSEILFLNRDGEAYGGRGVQKMIRQYLAKSGIFAASVSSLRHTFGTHHAMKGTSLETIQKVMGHKDDRSTSLYFSLAQEARNREIQDHAL